jgi:Subtilase family
MHIAIAALALMPALQVTETVERQVVLPELGRTLLERRWVDSQGLVVRQVVDEAGGVHSGAWLDRLRAEEERVGLLARGRLAPSLAEHLAVLAAGERTDVAVWLKDPLRAEDFPGQLRLATQGLAPEAVPAAIHAARLGILARKSEAYGPLTGAFAADAAAAGAEVLLETRSTPVVFLSADAATIRQLALDPRIDEVYRSMPTWVQEGGFAQGTLRTPTVKAQGLNAAASPVRVMVNDPGHVDASNIFLPPVTLLGSGSPDYHATGVAGNIANHHPQHFAAAAGLPSLLSGAGSGDTGAPLIWEQAIEIGLDFGNCSWWNLQKGSIEFLDRWFDATIRDFGVMLFKSNGNQGTTSTPYATTPGNGYNMISTGAYADQDNLDWADDAMASSSSYWNPIQGHDKPEVSSPGTCVATTTLGSAGINTCFGGTSSASPLTAGVATLLATGRPELLAEMTTLKALLMVSAWHNIEGAALLSEVDGAGGVHAAAAWAATRDQQWWHAVIQAGTLSPGFMDVTMTLKAGDETRVIALWFSNPDDALTTDMLEMDLDLSVLAPGGQVVASSISAVNPFELATFVPTVSGTYTVRLTKQRFDGVSEPVAWSTRADTATAYLSLAPGAGPIALGTTSAVRLSEPYTAAGQPYLLWAALAPGLELALPGGFALPVPLDALAYALLTLPGWTGLLDAFGNSPAVPVNVPNLPGLSGQTLSFGAAVLSAPGTPLTISTPFSVTF